VDCLAALRLLLDRPLLANSVLRPIEN